MNLYEAIAAQNRLAHALAVQQARTEQAERDAEDARRAEAHAVADAEQAERERDEARRQMQSMVAESLVPAEARVAALEAALQRILALSPHTTVRDAMDLARAALGDQEAKEGTDA